MAILNHLTRSVGTIFQFVLNWIFLKFVFFITSQSKIFASDYNSYENGIIRSDWKSAWKWNSESSWAGWWNSQANRTGWISETCWTDSRRYCQVEKSQETCCNGVFCWKKLPWNAKVRNESRIKMRKNHFRNLIKSQFFIVNWRVFFYYFYDEFSLELSILILQESWLSDNWRRVIKSFQRSWNHLWWMVWNATKRPLSTCFQNR